MIICKECGYSYQPQIAACPECGNPTAHNRMHGQYGAGTKTLSSISCPSCGAPSAAGKNCQWCGTAFPVNVTIPGRGMMSSNQVILECEFQKVVESRNAYSFVNCYVNVHGRTLMVLADDGSPHGIELWLLNFDGQVAENFKSYPDRHPFIRSDEGQYFKTFGVDFRSAAETAETILRQVYGVKDERILCTFEYGDNYSSGGDDGSGTAVAAGVIGGVIGSLIDW